MAPTLHFKPHQYDRVVMKKMLIKPMFSIGQHVHCGVRGRSSRHCTGSHSGVCLHLIWNHSQWIAHLFPLQQVLGLLHQAESPGVQHRLGEATLSAKEAPQAQTGHVLPSLGGRHLQREPLSVPKIREL